MYVCMYDLIYVYAGNLLRIVINARLERAVGPGLVQPLLASKPVSVMLEVSIMNLHA